jgi:hypothetical protein
MSTTMRILPSYVELWVPEEEQALYAEKYKNPLYTYPNNVRCHNDAMNAVRDTVKEKRIFFLDDDISEFRRPYRETSVKCSGEDVIYNICNLTLMAIDAGVPLYGFANIGSVRYYVANKPFTLSGFLSASCMGFNDTNLRTSLKLKGDVDLCLQALLEHRIILTSYMMAAVHNCDTCAGGNFSIKNTKNIEAAIHYLKEKWGKYVYFKPNRDGNYTIILKVTRQKNVRGASSAMYRRK